MTRDLHTLRDKLLAQLPDFVKPLLAQFEAMAQAEAEQEVARLRAELVEAHTRIAELEADNTRYYRVIMELDPSWAEKRSEQCQ